MTTLTLKDLEEGNITRLISLKEIANFLGYHVDYVRNLARKKEIGHIKIQRKVTFKPEHIINYLKSCEQEPINEGKKICLSTSAEIPGGLDLLSRDMLYKKVVERALSQTQKNTRKSYAPKLGDK